MTELTEFVLEGTIDGRPVIARWRDGFLDADPELRSRAELVVTLGEEFAVHDGSHRLLRASLLEGGYAAMLTLMRALDQVNAIELAVPGSPRARADRLFRSFRGTVARSDN